MNVYSLCLQHPSGKAPADGTSHAVRHLHGMGTTQDLQPEQPSLKAELAMSQMGDLAWMTELL